MSRVPFASIEHPLLPPSLLPTLHDCLHPKLPLYFAEFKAIVEAISGWPEAAERIVAMSKHLAATHLELSTHLTDKRRGVRRWLARRGHKDKEELTAQEQQLEADSRYYASQCMSWLGTADPF